MRIPIPAGLLWGRLSLILLVPLAFAQQPDAPEPGQEPRIPQRRPVELREDDKPAFPPPPAGWDQPRPGIPKGKLEMIEYDSKTVGTRRKANLYTPPGYTPERKYPVLYLLHGIGGDETEWQRFARPDVLLDNLIADGKAEPMIVVMPNGRAQKDDRAAGDVFKSAPAFAVFERDLLDDLIPAIESRYSTRKEATQRAIAGLSMGGGQSLNFGLGHPDRFAWIGGFSSAPNTRKPAELVPDPAAARKLELLWLSCGTRDGLFGISRDFHTYLKEQEVPHVWHVTDGSHDAAEWKQALHHFLQQLKFSRASTSAAAPAKPPSGDRPGLKDAFKDDFLVGTALNPWQSSGRAGRELDLIDRHFNSVTSENSMKWIALQPRPDRFEFAEADRFVEFGTSRGMKVIGHTLVWHSQTPRWVFEDGQGRPVSKEVLLERMRKHIHTVAGRYKGKVLGWDVVNEALEDDGSLRRSPWLTILGEDYLVKAFQFAHEADPGAELYYNDYSLEGGRKRDGALELVRKLQAGGVKLTGVGLQGHYAIDHPSADEIDRTIDAFAKLGLKVMITELDVNVLPTPGHGGAEISTRFREDARWNPWPDGLPPEMEQRLADRYAAIFGVFLKHREPVTRVTFWGVHDGASWLNHFPVRGRTNYPLLFDRTLQPKRAFDAVVALRRRPPAE